LIPLETSKRKASATNIPGSISTNTYYVLNVFETA